MRRPLLRQPSYGLRSKLFTSHLLVALVGTLTFLAAISLIAPAIFGNLMGGMMGRDGSMEPMGQSMNMGDMTESVSRAFGQTLFYSLLIATLVAVATAVSASLFVARRIVEPVRGMLSATRRIASGRYDERVPVREDDELGSLSESLNTMAAALEATERRRREFVADVSHELRTPITTLQGYMEGLMDGVVEPSQETWALLYGETERMRRLVDDLQQLSRAESGRLTLDTAPIPPGDALRLATESMLPLFADKGVQVGTEVRGTPPVRADAGRLVQVLTNLLANALRYTPEGGRVTVGVEPRDGMVLFTVADTGEGIASEHLPHVFERFYRVEKSRSREGGGSGVGLAVSRALVEAMGGDIWADSAGPGRGATFRFTLPAARE